MKRVLSIIFFVLLSIECLASQQGMFGTLARKNCGCSYTGCSAGCKLLDWDCSTTSMASNVCSMGDNTATLVGEANLTSGYIDLTDGSDNGGDSYTFSSSAFDIFPAGAATIKMTINMSVIANGTRLMSFYDDAENSFYITLVTASGNDIQVAHKGNNTLESNNFDANLSLSTQYSLVIAYDTVTGMDVSINGGSSWLGVPASSTITTMTSDGTTTMAIGNSAAANLEGSIDDVKIYSGYKVDL